MRLHLLKLDPNAWDENAVEFAGRLTGKSDQLEEQSKLALNVRVGMSGTRWAGIGRPVELDVALVDE